MGNLNTDSEQGILNAYNLLLILTGVAVSIHALAKVAESRNQLHYESREARIISGLIRLTVNLLHTSDSTIEMTTDGTIITAGPHRTGWEALVLAAKIKGVAPQFFATDYFNFIPGVSSFMKHFKVIPIGAKATKSDSGRAANADALDIASKAIQEKGCVALFPQGNFSKLGQEPFKVYPGAAKLAVANKTAIHVIRLDGYWSLQNPLIPLFVRNSVYYRAFLSGFHLNNVRTKLCCVIDFHLKPENERLSDEEKIEEINAQLYAYYRYTEELTEEQIDAIKLQISEEMHRPIWRNKVKIDDLQKALLKLKKEEADPVKQEQLESEILKLKEERSELEEDISLSIGYH